MVWAEHITNEMLKCSDRSIQTEYTPSQPCSGANSLNAIKILANSLIVIDPTCHGHKKIPSMPFSGIQGIGENFNGIQGINSFFSV